MANENPPFTADLSIQTSIYRGLSIATFDFPKGVDTTNSPGADTTNSPGLHSGDSKVASKSGECGVTGAVGVLGLGRLAPEQLSAIFSFMSA